MYKSLENVYVQNEIADRKIDFGRNLTGTYTCILNKCKQKHGTSIVYKIKNCELCIVLKTPQLSASYDFLYSII